MRCSAIKQFIGGWIVCAFTLLSGLCLVLAVQPWAPLLISRIRAVWGSTRRLPKPSDIQPDGLLHNGAGLLLLCIVMSLSWFASTVLGPIWATPAFEYFQVGALRSCPKFEHRYPEHALILPLASLA